MLEFALAELSNTAVSSEGPVWLEALPARVYHTPQYGPVPVTLDKLQRFVHNFNDGVRGQDIATDYDHGLDRAKGNKASGWYRGFKIGPSTKDPNQHSLYAQVEFTEEAKKEIKDGQWKYFSLEWDDLYRDSTTGATIPDVVIGGAITNRPVAKHTSALPINFSEAQWNELDSETRKAFAVWTTAFVNNLPDSAFLYIQPGGKQDDSGKTVPRTNRHFPYKGSDGKIDLPHLRNAIARIPQAGSWLSSQMQSTLQAKARALLAASSKMAETADADDTAITAALDAIKAALAKADDATDKAGLSKALSLLNALSADEKNEKAMAEIIELAFSEVPFERSEPGTNGAPIYGNSEQPDPGTGQPVPRVTGDVSLDDLGVANQWRQEPLPLDPNDPNSPRAPGREPPFAFNEGVRDMTPEQLAELYKLHGIDPNADDAADKLFEATKKSFAETKSLREAVGAVDEERRFAEQFPHMHARQKALETESRTNHALKFSESVRRFTRPEGGDTRNGLSQLAVEKVAEVHQKFSEGTATLADFEETISTITQGGVVEFGEIGSSTEDGTLVSTGTGLQGLVNARKLFAEKVAEIRQSDEKYKNDYAGAIRAAAEKYPDLAKQYRTAPVA